MPPTLRDGIENGAQGIGGPAATPDHAPPVVGVDAELDDHTLALRTLPDLDAAGVANESANEAGHELAHVYA